MEILSFYIKGKPEPKGRPRFTKSGHTYTPPKTKKWERDVAIQAKGKIAEPFTGALSITLVFWLLRPKSYPKGLWFHTKKPDLDNLIKAVLDGLEGVIFKGDQQIVDLHATKKYCGALPRVAIEVRLLG